MKRDAFMDPAFFGDPPHVQIMTLSAWFAAVIEGRAEFTMDGSKAFLHALDHQALSVRSLEIENARLREQVAHLQGGVDQGRGGGATDLGARVVSLDAYRKHPLVPSPGGAA